MTLKIVITLALCLCVSPLLAQNYGLKGLVADTAARSKLAGATILVLKAGDSTLLDYTYANSNGSFEFKHLPEGKFILLCTYPDHADHTDVFNLDAQHTTYDAGTIPLLLRSRLLKEVQVKGQAIAVKIKGDTTEYNAKAYVIQPNDKVEDLLKQLPGISVDKNGKITAQGETVAKVLLDGEEYFGDDPTLITQNLRADMVDKVQLYDKKSDQATFTGIDDGVKTKTINIKLKEDKKNGIFGKAAAGAGTRGYNEAQAMYNRFKTKEKYAAYATLANDGKTGLGFEDSFKLGAAGNSVIYEGSILSYNTDDDLDNGTYNGDGLPKARSGGIHYDGKNNGDKASVNINYKIGALDVTGIQTSTNQQTLPGNVFTKNGTRNFDNHNFRQKLDITYQLKLDTSSNLKIVMNGLDRNNRTVSNSYINTTDINSALINRNIKNVANNSDQNGFDASALYTHKFSKPRRTLSWNVSGTYNKNTVNGTLYSTIDLYSANGKLDSTQLTDQRKLTVSTSSVINSNVTYSEPLSNTFAVVLNYGIGFDHSSTNRQVYDVSAPAVLDPLYSNNYRFAQLADQLGAAFSYKKDRTILTFGTKTTNVDLKQTDVYTGKVYQRDFLNWSPQASYQYKFSTSRSLTLNYEGNSTQPTIDQIQPIRINNDPLNILMGNAGLVASYTNFFHSFFNMAQLLSGQNFRFICNFSFTTNAIVNSTATDAAGRSTTQYVNLSKKDPYNFYLYAAWDRKTVLFGLDAGLSGTANQRYNYSYINGQLNRSSYNTYDVHLSLSRSKLKKYTLQFYAGPTYTVNQMTLQPQNNNNAAGFNWILRTNFYLPGKLQFGTDLFADYKAKTRYFEAQNINQLSASLSKTFLKNDALKLSLTGHDLLNQNQDISRSVIGNVSSQSSYNSIRRYIMFSVSWDFNKFGTIKEN